MVENCLRLWDILDTYKYVMPDISGKLLMSSVCSGEISIQRSSGNSRIS